MTGLEILSEGLIVAILGMGFTFVVLCTLWLIMSIMGKLFDKGNERVETI